MENFGKFMFLLIIAALSLLINGFVIYTLWSWFIVSTFNVTKLTLMQSMGISLFIGYFKVKYRKEPIDESEWVPRILFEIISSAMVLALGWLVTLFM